ncbi:MAG: hypothetical protein M0Z60_00055 [Nitrospiraceae bacterium]|nr:hypothetical protein [Nitrospiraceae bacterium]
MARGNMRKDLSEEEKKEMPLYPIGIVAELIGTTDQTLRLYEKHGLNKTMRKLQLSEDEILELVEIVDTMIEDKKSKIKIKFSGEELKKIADLINEKIRV